MTKEHIGFLKMHLVYISTPKSGHNRFLDYYFFQMTTLSSSLPCHTCIICEEKLVKESISESNATCIAIANLILCETENLFS